MRHLFLDSCREIAVYNHTFPFPLEIRERNVVDIPPAIEQPRLSREGHKWSLHVQRAKLFLSASFDQELSERAGNCINARLAARFLAIEVSSNSEYKRSGCRDLIQFGKMELA